MYAAAFRCVAWCHAATAMVLMRVTVPSGFSRTDTALCSVMEARATRRVGRLRHTAPCQI